VVVGVDRKDGAPHQIMIHNPSGRKPELRANASISIERFEAAYTGRVVIPSRN
jgi:hypothetical protein